MKSPIDPEIEDARAAERRGVWNRVMNEGGPSIGTIVRAGILLAGFAFTKIVSVFGLFRFRLFRKIYSSIYFLGKRFVDAEKIKLMRKQIKPGDVVLDIGAAFGFFSARAAALVGPTGKVLAFEPDPKFHPFLDDLRRGGKLPNTEIYNLAAWHEAAELDLHLCAENPGENSLFQSPVHGGKVRVPAAALDAFLNPETTVDFVKMDIQGAEISAIKGMRDLLRRSKEVVVLTECSPADLAAAGSGIVEMLRILSDMRFYVYRMDGAALTPVHSANDLSDLRRRRLGQCDLFCARQPHHES